MSGSPEKPKKHDYCQFRYRQSDAGLVPLRRCRLGLEGDACSQEHAVDCGRKVTAPRRWGKQLLKMPIGRGSTRVDTGFNPDSPKKPKP